MTFLLESKEKLKQFYAHYSTIITPVLKFILAFAVFKGINGQLPYMEKLDNIFVLLILSLICSIMPINTTVIFGMFLLVGQCYGVGIEIAGFALALLMIIFILYVRFVPRDAVILLMTPLAFILKIPCVIPIGYGLTRTPASAVSAGCGVVVYYFMDLVKTNEAALRGAEKEQITENLKFMLDGLMKNQDMMMNLIAFVTVLLIVSMVRKMAVKYAWHIAIGVGAVSYLVIMVAGSVLLDVNCPIVPLVSGTLGAVVVTLILEFFLLNVDYTKIENLQFEDDEYYYYVKAVPKMGSISKENSSGEATPTDALPVETIRQMQAAETEKREDFGQTQVLHREIEAESGVKSPVSQETIALTGLEKPYRQIVEQSEKVEEEKVDNVDFEFRLEQSLKDL